MQVLKILVLLVFSVNCQSIKPLTMRRPLTDPRKIVEYVFTRWQSMYNIAYRNQTAYNSALPIFKMSYMNTLRHKLDFYTYKSNFLMELNRYATTKNKSFLVGARFDDSKTSSTGVMGRNLPVFPPPPPSLDYRKMGFVTDVSDQGFLCSSCYAFASVCGIEGQVAKNFGILTKLSPQNIVDCSKNLQCDGGNIGLSYRYIISNSGIAHETSYPYRGVAGTCKYKQSMLAQNISSFTFVTGDENYLKSVLAAVGPLPVGMKGSLDSFYYYSSGIYDDPTCTGTIDHAVCLVGYGTDNTTSPPTDYWIVKNSWSTDWGENGYFRLKMGSNLCGIRNYVVYPRI